MGRPGPPPRRRISAVLILFMATWAVAFEPASGAGAATEVSPQATEISVVLHPPKDYVHHLLRLQVYPAQGVAVVSTQVDVYAEPRGVLYAIQIPREPFDGSLDLTFPGLGRIDGTIDADPEPVDCAAGASSADAATFTGTFRFHGAGDGERWAATEAGAVVACTDVQVPRGRGSKSLFEAVALRGPGFDGPVQVAFFARSQTARRALEFVAVASTEREGATFLAVDREWLPGEIATERWVKCRAATSRGKLDVEPWAGAPERVTLTPPSPFLGKAVYRTPTRRLTGSLGVRFPGLTLRLARPPMTGKLVDEEPDRRARAPLRSDPTYLTSVGFKDLSP